MKKYLLFCLFLLTFLTVHAQIISTFAGGRNFGDGQPAINALASNPKSLKLDRKGNVYFFGDYGRIRKITKSTGIISTVAGSGTTGFSGDGGPAILASIDALSNFSINSIAIDTSDNIYFSDENNNRVRKVNAATGIITTIAGNGVSGFSGDGGPAVSANLSHPRAIAVDDSGNVYLSDGYDVRIRKISGATGIITTIAGQSLSGNTGDGGLATLARVVPSSIIMDSTYNIYFADKSNSVIRMITVTTGIISKIAGRGSAGTSGDGGPAANAYINVPLSIAFDTLQNIYISTVYHIRKITAATGIINTIAGNNQSSYNGDEITGMLAAMTPYGISADSTGNIYFADYQNHRIREITTDNVIHTIGGNGTQGFMGDGIAASQASLNQPNAVTTDSVGNIYIADNENYRIRKVDAFTNIITTFAGTGVSANTGDNELAVNATFSRLSDISADDSLNIYLADVQNGRVRKISKVTGLITTVAGANSGIFGDGGLAINAELKPYCMVTDTAGSIYLMDFYSYKLRQVDARTNIINTIAGAGGTGAYLGDGGPALQAYIGSFSAIVVDTAGNVYFPDHSHIRKVTRATGVISSVAGTGNAGYSGDGGPATGASISVPFGITLDKAGNIYFSDDNRIRKITVATGIISTIAGTGVSGYSGDGGPATNAQFNYISCICFDKYGDMYVSEVYNNTVRKITNPVTSIRDGNWSDPLTWSNGKVPDIYTQVTISNNILVDINAFAYSVLVTSPNILDIQHPLNVSH